MLWPNVVIFDTIDIVGGIMSHLGVVDHEDIVNMEYRAMQKKMLGGWWSCSCWAGLHLNCKVIVVWCGSSIAGCAVVHGLSIVDGEHWSVENLGDVVVVAGEVVFVFVFAVGFVGFVVVGCTAVDVVGTVDNSNSSRGLSWASHGANDLLGHCGNDQKLMNPAHHLEMYPYQIIINIVLERGSPWLPFEQRGMILLSALGKRGNCDDDGIV